MCDILVIVAPGVSTRSCVRRRPAQLADTMQSVNDIVSGVFVDVEGARGPLSQRWQTSGRFNARSLAGREASAMGCHSRFHPSGLLSQCHSSPGGCSCRVGINRKSGKMRSPPRVLRFQAHSDWVVGLSQRVSVELVPAYGSQNQFSHRRWPGRSVSLSTVVGHSATFQCHSVAPDLCREWAVGPLVIPASFFPHFFAFSPAVMAVHAKGRIIITIILFKPPSGSWLPRVKK